MRKLNDKFIDDLKNENGLLYSLMQFILNDDSLELMIRDNYINIYYRGGNLLKVEQQTDTYRFTFDNNYLIYKKETVFPNSMICNKDILIQWIEIIPFLKQNIDIYRTTKKSNLEREYQQLIVKECNELKKSISNGSEIFIIDIEYANGNGRFDLIGIEWDRDKATLKGNYKPKLLLIEMKFGDDAICGKNENKKSADIKQHIRDVENFINPKNNNLEQLKNETIIILKQKRELGLFRGMQHNKNEVIDLDIEKPNLIILLGAHNPRSVILKNVLDTLPVVVNINIKFSVANFMGYGLYADCIYELDEFKNIFEKQIFSKNSK